MPLPVLCWDHELILEAVMVVVRELQQLGSELRMETCFAKLPGKVSFLIHIEFNCYQQENTLKVLEIFFFICTSRADPVAFMNAFIFLNISWKLVGILVEERE